MNGSNDTLWLVLLRSDDCIAVFSLVKVFADLLADPEQVLMVSLSKALQEIGYAIEV